MNQPQLDIGPLPLETPSRLAPHPTPLGCLRALGLSSLNHTENSLAIYFTYGDLYVFMLPSQFVPPSPFPLEKAMAPHSSTLAWKIPWTEEPGGLQSMGSLRVRHACEASLSVFTSMHWRRKWQPTPVFLPGEPQGRGSLVGCCLWGRTESDTTEAT